MHGTAKDDKNMARRSIQKVNYGFNTRRAVGSALTDDAEGAQDMDNDELADGMTGLRFGEEGDGEQDNVEDDTDLNPNILSNVWEDRWAAIDAMDISVVRKSVEASRYRKLLLNKYVLAKVRELKRVSHQQFERTDRSSAAVDNYQRICNEFETLCLLYK